MPEAQGPWSIAPPEKSQPDDDNAPKTEEAKRALSDVEIVAIFNEYIQRINPKKVEGIHLNFGYEFAKELYDKGGLATLDRVLDDATILPDLPKGFKHALVGLESSKKRNL